MIHSLKEKILSVFVYAILAFVICAVVFQVTMVGLELSGRSNITTNIARWFSWKFDGRFSESKGNIWYQSKHVYVSSVNNLIKVGPLTNNQNLKLGVKNVLEEALQDKGYTIVSNAWDADISLDVDIIYFDIKRTKTNLAVFHKDDNAVIIRMRGQLIKEGKVEKEAIVEESSSEIVASTGLVAADGKFNSAVSRNAVKKTCVAVVNKLF